MSSQVDAGFLASRPKRALKWEQDGDGRVILLRPKFGSGAFGRRVQAWFGLSYYRIRLDEMGSLVWKSIDGQTPLSEVVQRLRDEFGDKIEPAEQRLAEFVRQMMRGRLIEL